MLLVIPSPLVLTSYLLTWSLTSHPLFSWVPNRIRRGGPNKVLGTFSGMEQDVNQQRAHNSPVSHGWAREIWKRLLFSLQLFACSFFKFFARDLPFPFFVFVLFSYSFYSSFLSSCYLQSLVPLASSSPALGISSSWERSLENILIAPFPGTDPVVDSPFPTPAKTQFQFLMECSFRSRQFETGN